MNTCTPYDIYYILLNNENVYFIIHNTYIDGRRSLFGFRAHNIQIINVCTIYVYTYCVYTVNHFHVHKQTKIISPTIIRSKRVLKTKYFKNKLSSKNARKKKKKGKSKPRTSRNPLCFI